MAAAASSKTITDEGAPKAKSPFANTAGRYLNRNWNSPSSQCVMDRRVRPFGSRNLDYDAPAVRVETRPSCPQFLSSPFPYFFLFTKPRTAHSRERTLLHRRRLH